MQRERGIDKWIEKAKGGRKGEGCVTCCIVDIVDISPGREMRRWVGQMRGVIARREADQRH